MTQTTLIKNPRQLIAAGTAVAAGAAQRGTQDLRTAQGGLLTAKVKNGPTGPTAQALIRVLVAHNAGATPAPASAGTDWKTIYEIGCGTLANAETEVAVPIDPAVMHVEVEIIGHTGQGVTAEAFLSEITAAQSV